MPPGNTHLYLDRRLRPIGKPVPKWLLSNLVSGLGGLGVDVDASLARFGLSAASLNEIEEGRLRWSFLYDFWEAVRETSGQAGLGLRIGEQASLQYYGVVGHLIANGATLGDALVLATQFVRLVLPNIECAFSVDGQRSQLFFKAVEPEWFHPEASELLLAATGVIARQLAGVHLMPLEVRFSHAAPADLSQYKRLFGAQALRFDQPQNGYVFDSSLLTLPVRGSDTELRERMQHEAEKLRTTQPTATGLKQTVQEAIHERLWGGNYAIEHVAERLGMHPRTLRRRLKAEGTSYQRLLDQLRYQLAKQYLHEPGVTIAQVATLLGYADASSFNKAFKRWSGAAPHCYRERTLASFS